MHLAEEPLIDRPSFPDKILFSLYSLFFILKPFYLWNSGLPQIADFMMVLLILFYGFKKRFLLTIPADTKRFVLVGFIFVFYATFVNLIWTLIINLSTQFLTTSLFYIYNILIAVLMLSLLMEYKEKIIAVTYKAVLISVLLQMAINFAGGGFAGERMTGGFNNPNQLGYYALLIASYLVYLSDKTKVKISLFMLGLLSSLLLAFASLSKAAILSMGGLILVFLISKSQNKRLKRRITLIVILLSAIIGFLYATSPNFQENPLLLSVNHRISTIGKSQDDNLEGRGYDRFTNYPQYWIAGAGEGYYARFNDTKEFHSILGNIQVSYGMIGTLLFLAFLLIAIKKDPYRSGYILFFILLYGLSHNGIRNTMFWILLALMAYGYERAKAKGDFEQANL